MSERDWPPSGTLASYTDQDGYTVRIDCVDDPIERNRKKLPRYGTMIVTSPDGISIKTLRWMNWPEDTWNISDAEWEALSWKDRATLEVKQQATAYDPLRVQFITRLRLELVKGMELVTQTYVSYYKRSPRFKSSVRGLNKRVEIQEKRYQAIT